MARTLFCERLRSLRKERGLTLAEAATQVNVSYDAMAGYETGKREPAGAILARIEHFYGVSGSYLFGWTDSQAVGPTLHIGVDYGPTDGACIVTMKETAGRLEIVDTHHIVPVIPPRANIKLLAYDHNGTRPDLPKHKQRGSFLKALRRWLYWFPRRVLYIHMEEDKQ